MNLMCAVAGKAKNAFVVNISKDARVSALMDVVESGSRGKYGPFPGCSFPTLALKNPNGDDFNPGYGEIHVLVVIPTAEPARKKQKLQVDERFMEIIWAGARRISPMLIT
ncbi:hypothetical protein DVH05_015783 [Phytophthora capsici]|nr:hypothetical protein DVH05_015783 [Phytophthora capsici]